MRAERCFVVLRGSKQEDGDGAFELVDMEVELGLNIRHLRVNGPRPKAGYSNLGSR